MTPPCSASQRSLLVTVVSLSLLVSACVRRSEIFFADLGSACPAPEGHTGYLGDPMTFEAGDAIVITVIHDACLSSSCDVDRHMTCEVTLDGTQLLVHSEGGYIERDGYVTCTDDCGWLQAECTSPPLPAGDYVILHGDDEVQLTIPSTVSGLCDLFYL